MSSEARRFSGPPKLSIPNPELLRRTGNAIRQWQNYFFLEARMGRNFSGYLNVIRNALEVVEFVPEIAEFEERYGKWLAMDNDSIVQAGLDSPELSHDQMLSLAARNDPTMYVIGTYETIRPSIPNTQLNTSVEDQIFTVYRILGASVHRD